MVNDGDTPGHNDIITDVNCLVAYKVACTQVTAIANTYLTL
jgi:hypothetical protein